MLLAEYLQLYKKETPVQAFSCVYCKTLKNTFFTEHVLATTPALQRIFFFRTLNHVPTNM